MKAKLVGYWITLVLFSLPMAAGGIADISQIPAIAESMAKLGYPPYLATILGVWKLAGVLAVLIPGCALLKEWAYAGFFFDLTGASVSHYFVKDPVPEQIIPLVILAIGMTSWYLRPASRCVYPQPQSNTST